MHFISEPARFRRAGGAREQSADSGTLVIDGRGVIVRCSVAAGQVFGGEPGDVERRSVASFVADLLPCDTSPSYNARYIAYLSSDGSWHRFQAVDVFGRPFVIEIAMSKLETERRNLFLLELRFPAAA